MLIQFARCSFPDELPPTCRVKIANWWTHTEKSELNWMSELNFIRTGMAEVVSTRKSAAEPPPSFNIHQTIHEKFRAEWEGKTSLIIRKAESGIIERKMRCEKRRREFFWCQTLRTTFFRNQLYKFFLLPSTPPSYVEQQTRSWWELSRHS